jgi:16S rRNA (cytosine967-C5)-methyltransferase
LIILGASLAPALFKTMFETSYKILQEIIKDGAYVNIALNSVAEKDRAFVTKLVYGVLERYYELDYVVAALSEKTAKRAVRLVLMQAVYAIKFLSVKDYAVVNESVNLTVKIGKKELKGYVNAVLQKVTQGLYYLPSPHDPRFEEVKFNLPAWFIDAVKKEYPFNFSDILGAKAREEEHVRLSPSFLSEKFESEFKDAEKTQTGYYIKNNAKIKQLFQQGDLTFQSLTSTLAIDALGDVLGKTVLDVASAPGGKSVYLAHKGAKVTANDIHPHRLKLVESYAKRMKVNLKTEVQDATVFKEKYKNAFDVVLLDVPCSGFGVIAKRRDMIFNKKEEDIDTLAKLQLKMINNCCNYVKSGGVLLYSTCTIFSKENSGLIKKFVENNSNFTLLEEKQYLPDGKGLDGFYVAKLIKK